MAHIHKKFELNRTKIEGAIRKIIRHNNNNKQTKKAGPRRLALAQPQKYKKPRALTSFQEKFWPAIPIVQSHIQDKIKCLGRHLP